MSSLTIDQIIVNFDAALRSGRHPKIEDYLSQLPVELTKYRSLVLGYLLTAEMSYLTSINDGVKPTRRQVIEAHQEMSEEITLSFYHRASNEIDSSPVVIDGYSIEENISSGAEGSVVRAFPLFGGGKSVALKFYHESTPKISIQREKRALEKLDHHLIVKLLNSGNCLQYEYIALEFIDYPRLPVLYSESNPRVDDVYRIIDQLCEALQHCHENGVFHGDVKPDNLMASHDRKFKLLDFGLSLFGGSQTQPSMAMPEYSGTYEYMPPEKAKALDNVDLKLADIFGIGAVLFWLLTKKTVFGSTLGNARSPELVREEAVQNAVGHKWLERPKRYSPDLVNLCVHALASNPADRPQTIEAIRTEIEQIRANDWRASSGWSGLQLSTHKTPPTPTISAAAEVRFRKAKLAASRLRIQLDPSLWAEIYRPIKQERRGLKRIVSMSLSLEVGAPLIAVENGAVVFSAPLDCIYKTNEQMADEDTVVLAVAPHAFPVDILQLAEEPDDGTRSAFLEVVQVWLREMEDSGKQALVDLAGRQQRALLSYDRRRENRIRKNDHLVFLNRFRRSINMVSWFACSVFWFVLLLWIMIREGYTPSDTPDENSVSNNTVAIFVFTGAVFMGWNMTFLCGMRKLIIEIVTLLPPADHPFHKRHSSQFIAKTRLWFANAWAFWRTKIGRQS